jgi:hypothetical protein
MGKLRKPTHPVPREPIDPPSPPGSQFPFAWYPDVAINLYGFLKDLEIRPQDTADDLALKAEARDTLKRVLEGALAGLLPGAVVDVQIAFDSAYDGFGTKTCLSIGAWLQTLTVPNDPDAVASRRRGLFELRSGGERANFGEILLNFAVVDQLVRRTLLALPSRLGSGAPSITVNAIGVTATPPASVTVLAFLSTAVPVLGAVNHTVTVIVTLEKNAAGNVQVRVANVALSGDFLIGVFDASVFAAAFVPPIVAFSIREFFMGAYKLVVTYGNPSIGRRGARQFVSGQQSIVFPVTWQFTPRLQSVTVDGPFQVTIQGARKVAQYRAVAKDFVNPVFSWMLDGRVQPSQTGSSAAFTFLAASLPAEGSVTRRIEVTVSEPGASSVTRSATRRTIVQRGDLE